MEKTDAPPRPLWHQPDQPSGHRHRRLWLDPEFTDTARMAFWCEGCRGHVMMWRSDYVALVTPSAA